MARDAGPRAFRRRRGFLREKPCDEAGLGSYWYDDVFLMTVILMIFTGAVSTVHGQSYGPRPWAPRLFPAGYFTSFPNVPAIFRAVSLAKGPTPVIVADPGPVQSP